MSGNDDEKNDDLRPEYDFSKGARGKYARGIATGSNVVVLDPDVAHVFSDSAAVNRALRALVEIAAKQGAKAAS
ncbi:hypothetical protein L6V77_13370 [Myxococcota bacterium]|nr:hypothetical protein [Myxococcota bacterium]